MAKNAEFFIPGRLPGLNEIISSVKIRKGRNSRYEREKREITFFLCRIIQAEKVSKFKKCRIGFRWVEPDRKRDIDNISAGKKYILDALVWAGVIADDSWKCVRGFLHEEFVCDHRNPGVWVRLEEID
jgi:Holliday junction resolvase RusA-like endonuclease